ncbi:hypothetical protein Cgig2_015253 [Carnegiea gigantea]|uniref:Uncharacterized protein n=1 Tax=Carnegiea gigantea TaxID=171969 RepID=A0A9Q1KKH3_9CARY|nr:hypothetical protein Cgig2_015253 [Carnegiea gigantea]
MSAKALLPVAIYHHPSFDRRSLPLPSLSCIFSSFKFFLFKPQNSLQTHFLLHPIPQSSALPSNNSTPLATKSVSAKKPGSSDPELRAVLELATNSELFELEEILFGPSYFSPMLKSISSGVKFDRFMIEEDFEEREQFINVLESRFLYLAADARSTLREKHLWADALRQEESRECLTVLHGCHTITPSFVHYHGDPIMCERETVRGWRPSYRNVLLDVRKVLSIPCSRKLPTEDLETGCKSCALTAFDMSVQFFNPETRKQGSQLVALLKISEMVSSRLSRTMLLEAVKRKIGSEAIKKVNLKCSANVCCKSDHLANGAMAI